MLFNPIHLPYWILLGIGVALFLLVIFAGGGDDEVGIETDVDADVDLDLDLDAVDLDIDTDVEMEVDGDAEGNFQLVQLLGWLGVGKAPLLLLLAIDFSLWGLFGWILNTVTFGVLGVIVFVASLGLSLFSGSLISRPIGKIFASFGEDASGERLIGCIGRVSSATIPLENRGKIGQIDVFDPARNLVTVSAVLPQWAETSPRRGEEVVVIDRRGGTYVAIAKNSPDRDRWLGNLPKKRK